MKEVLAQELQNYMHSLLPEPKAWQTEMLAEAESEHIPIVEEEIANFLALLVKINRSKHILEIGTAIVFNNVPSRSNITNFFILVFWQN